MYCVQWQLLYGYHRFLYIILFGGFCYQLHKTGSVSSIYNYYNEKIYIPDIQYSPSLILTFPLLQMAAFSISTNGKCSEKATEHIKQLNALNKHHCSSISRWLCCWLIEWMRIYVSNQNCHLYLVVSYRCWKLCKITDIFV